MLHLVRGIGNAIGTYFIGPAQQEMQEQRSPSRDLACILMKEANT